MVSLYSKRTVIKTPCMWWTEKVLTISSSLINAKSGGMMGPDLWLIRFLETHVDMVDQKLGRCRKWPEEEAEEGLLLGTHDNHQEWVPKAAMLHPHLPDSSLYVTCYLHCLVLACMTMPGFNVEAWDWNSGPHIWATNILNHWTTSWAQPTPQLLSGPNASGGIIFGLEQPSPQWEIRNLRYKWV